MSSVADRLRRETRDRIQQLSAMQRVALAFELGERDVALYRSAHGSTDAKARAALRAARSIGRVASVTNQPR